MIILMFLHLFINLLRLTTSQENANKYCTRRYSYRCNEVKRLIHRHTELPGNVLQPCSEAQHRYGRDFSPGGMWHVVREACVQSRGKRSFSLFSTVRTFMIILMSTSEHKEICEKLTLNSKCYYESLKLFKLNFKPRHILHIS